MRTNRAKPPTSHALLAGALILLALAGCDEGAPPLDDLPLRDALRADPTVIATMSDDARLRLAARLEAARAGDDASDPVAGDPASTAPAVLVGEADAVRAQRSGDALVVGAIGSGVARALPSEAPAAATTPLPPLEVEASDSPVTALESRALQGHAGGLLRAVLAAAGAHHLRRVLGWPTGAVAIDDTVYVGAAWLAALAPANSADGGADAGAPPAPAPSNLAATSTATAATNSPAIVGDGNDSPDGGAIRATPTADSVGAPYPGYPDGGVIVVYPPTTPQPRPPPPSNTTDDSCGAAADSCAACSASTDDSDSCDGGTDDSSDDSCNNTDDGSDDSCNNTDDGSDNSCNSTGDGGDDTNCQVSRRSRQHGGTSPNMMISLFAPLAFLFSRRRR